MRYFILLSVAASLLVGCSGGSLAENRGGEGGFFSKYLVFSKPEYPYIDKRQLAANIYTIQSAKEKRQEVSYDPYYPIPKPWSEKPEAVSSF